ncbi:hypothetical protein GDO81_022612 [Engystomops pustulosus]|uniref:Uncharacterized protein n=1 Tax=Engystomops pustulosus TaxID=76066 RepID=A0AAV6Z5Y6_ENGPU|nr:hypothetical protein GDO81_022612 [Engystomops pustulosus]
MIQYTPSRRGWGAAAVWPGSLCSSYYHGCRQQESCFCEAEEPEDPGDCRKTEREKTASLQDYMRGHYTRNPRITMKRDHYHRLQDYSDEHSANPAVLCADILLLLWATTNERHRSAQIYKQVTQNIKQCT